MRRSILFIPLLLLGACGDDRSSDTTAPASSTTTPTGVENTLPDQDGESLEPNATIERVVDGDTIVVEVGGQIERVRLIGIDTPESVAEDRPDQCFGVESADYLTSLIPPGTGMNRSPQGARRFFARSIIDGEASTPATRTPSRTHSPTVKSRRRFGRNPTRTSSVLPSNRLMVRVTPPRS